MKKIIYSLLITCAFVNSGSGQVIGANGEGFSGNITQEDISQIKDLAKYYPLAIRWPGGGDSKVAFPSLDKPGLGMNKDSLIALYDAFRDNEDQVKEDELKKDLKNYETDIQKTQSDLMNLIRVAHQVKNFQVDYCLNVMQGTPASNLSAIQTLIDSGVNIISIVAGNETFFSYRFDFERYRKDFEPIVKACKKKYPNIPVLLCIGQNIDSKQHIAWNNALISYINAHPDLVDGVDIHYYMAQELKPAIALHPKLLVMKKETYYPELDKAFAKYIELYKKEDAFPSLIQYLHENLPGKIYHCTEFGDKNAENWSNTIASAGHAFYIFCAYRNDFNILLAQNLMGNWLWSARRPPSHFDENPDNVQRINRCLWYSVKLANEIPYDIPELTGKITITKEGVYYYYFNNAGGKACQPDIKFYGVGLATYETHYITGKYTYSSAGSTGFMDKGSDKSLEVKGITVDKSGSVAKIPANAFGYVKITTK